MSELREDAINAARKIVMREKPEIADEIGNLFPRMQTHMPEREFVERDAEVAP
jgi:hypothetical protein